jgi:hypothetical protein
MTAPRFTEEEITARVRQLGISARSVPDCTVTKYVARTQAPELTEDLRDGRICPESRCLSYHSKANQQMEKVAALRSYARERVALPT